MACLRRHWMDVRTLWNPRALVVLAGTLCAASCASHAAPVTFRFDAEIVNVPAGNPFDLPLTFKVGDVIHGKFTFEPGSGMPIGNDVIAANQSFALQFDISGTVVGTSGYSIEVFDDTAFDDTEFPEPIDVMTLGCNEPSCIPDLISLTDSEPFRVRSRMQFVGISSILLAPEIMADPAIWNAFLLERRLNLNFDNEGPGAMGFQAAVGDFSLVPEPTTPYCMTIGGMLAILPLTTIRRPQLQRVFAVGVLAIAFCALGTTVQAAPITFRFDAEIFDVAVGNPFDLPIAFQEGDTIHGKLTFEPGIGIPIGNGVIEADQAFGLEFDINGTVVGSSTYSIQAFDNTAYDDSEFEGPLDQMIVACSPSSSQACSPGLITLPIGDPFSIGARLVLIGDDSIFIAPQISSNSLVWNSFTLERSLALSFRNQDTGSAVLHARIGSFVPVPEPATSFLVKALASCICMRLASKKLAKKIWR